MVNFTGTLNHNVWATMLFNAFKYMGIKPNLESIDMSLVEAVREEGGKLNDTNTYTAIDKCVSRIWDPNDGNVLANEQTPNFIQKKMTVSNARQVAISKSYFLDKQIWGNEGMFGEYISLVDSQMEKAKKLYESKLISVKVGCMEAAEDGFQKQTVSLQDPASAGTATEAEAMLRINGQTIANKLADLEEILKDPADNLTDIKFYDGFDKGMFDIIWNTEYLNKINYMDLPTVYHSDYFKFNGKKLLSKFMGKASINNTADGTTDRASDQYIIRVDDTGTYSAAGTKIKICLPGDLLPAETPIVADDVVETYSNYEVVTTSTGKVNNKPVTRKVNYQVFSTVHAYVADASIICKIVALGKDVKFISSFRTDGTFQNYKNNTENLYSTWMFSNVERTGFYPLITLRKA